MLPGFSVPENSMPPVFCYSSLLQSLSYKSQEFEKMKSHLAISSGNERCLASVVLAASSENERNL